MSGPPAGAVWWRFPPSTLSLMAAAVISTGTWAWAAKQEVLWVLLGSGSHSPRHQPQDRLQEAQPCCPSSVGANLEYYMGQRRPCCPAHPLRPHWNAGITAAAQHYRELGFPPPDSNQSWRCSVLLVFGTTILFNNPCHSTFFVPEENNAMHLTFAWLILMATSHPLFLPQSC